MAIKTVVNVTIGTLFAGPTEIRVPDFQRNYSWEKEHVSELWEDIARFNERFPAASMDKAEYFLGAILTADASPHHILIDGQQRLATLTILLSVVRDQFKALNCPREEDRVQRLIFDQGHPSLPPRIPLTLNAYDRDFFRSLVQEGQSPEPKVSQASHRLLRGARDLLRSRLQARLADLGSDEARTQALLRLWGVIEQRLKVVQIVADSEEHATDIFETLNDRGLELSTLDLVRNLTLSAAAQSDRAFIVESWKEVFSVSEKAASLNRFLRHYWVSRYGDVKSRNLYSEMSHKLKTAWKDKKSTPRTFTIDLTTAAEVYRGILAQSTENKELDAVLTQLDEVGAVVTYPAVLAALEKHAAQVALFSRRLLSLFVRWNLISGKDTTELEAFLFALAREIYEGKMDLDKVQAFSPTDDDFKREFGSAILTKPGHQRHVLTRLEGEIRRRKSQNDVGPNENCWIEHIYPQSPIDGQRLSDHDAWVNRIGNLTLLHKRLNAKARNSPFGSKVAHYKSSAILLTQQLCDERAEAWGPKDIERRQAGLAELAPKIWSLTD